MHPNDREASIYTAHEIDRTGHVVRIYHRTDSGSSWTHPVGQTYRYWAELGSSRRKAEGSYGWVEVSCQCPLNTPLAGDRMGQEAGEPPQGPADPGSTSSASDQRSARRA